MQDFRSWQKTRQLQNDAAQMFVFITSKRERTSKQREKTGNKERKSHWHNLCCNSSFQMSLETILFQIYNFTCLIILWSTNIYVTSAQIRAGVSDHQNVYAPNLIWSAFVLHGLFVQCLVPQLKHPLKHQTAGLPSFAMASAENLWWLRFLQAETPLRIGTPTDPR